MKNKTINTLVAGAFLTKLFEDVPDLLFPRSYYFLENASSIWLMDVGLSIVQVVSAYGLLRSKRACLYSSLALTVYSAIFSACSGFGWYKVSQGTLVFNIMLPNTVFYTVLSIMLIVSIRSSIKESLVTVPSEKSND